MEALHHCVIVWYHESHQGDSTRITVSWLWVWHTVHDVLQTSVGPAAHHLSNIDDETLARRSAHFLPFGRTALQLGTTVDTISCVFVHQNLKAALRILITVVTGGDQGKESSIPMRLDALLILCRGSVLGWIMRDGHWPKRSMFGLRFEEVLGNAQGQSKELMHGIRELFHCLIERPSDLAKLWHLTGPLGLFRMLRHRAIELTTFI
mmetsp:Transcript_6631/g.14978  ORF Transcript_6631/g.14978 Transcript_6631/m.14978 type:complete len:207 (+) Transcript_6631:1356-1976(+)